MDFFNITNLLNISLDYICITNISKVYNKNIVT